MNIQLSTADLDVKGNFYAGGDIFIKLEHNSPFRGESSARCGGKFTPELLHQYRGQRLKMQFLWDQQPQP
jgi:hypothetical protein